MQQPHNKTYGTVRCWVHEEGIDGDTDELGDPDHEQPIGSYVQQWGEILAAGLGVQDISGVTDTSGTDQIVSNNPDTQLDAGAGATAFGVVIGDGGGAEDISDNAMSAKLTSAFDYGAVTVGTGTVSGSSVIVDVTRTFTNVSGTEQTITEVGLTARVQLKSGASDFLIVRDNLASDVTVDDADNHTVEYSLEFQV